MQFTISLSRIWQFYSMNFRISGIVELWGISTKLRYLLKISSDEKKIYYCELYSIVYGEIIFLNDNQYFYVYLYWGKCPLGHIPPPCKTLHKNFFKFFSFFILDVYCYK